MECVKTPIEESHNLPCGDPVSVLWTAAQSQDFNVHLAAQNVGNIVFAPNSTDPAVALTKSPVGDLSPVAGKDLVLSVTWTYQSGTCCGSNQKWGFFLTTNGTLPTQHGYNVKTDPSVALYVEIQATGGGNFLYTLFTQKKQTESISAEDAGGCSQAGSPYLCFTSTIDPTANNVNVNPLLNYTGTSATTTCTGNGLGAGCSYLAIQNTPLPPSLFGESSSQTLPWFQFQSVSYFFGFWASANLPFSPKLQFQGGGSIPFSPQIYSQTPTVNTGLAPTIDTGGFFGPVIKALVNLGVFILNSLLSFVAFIAPALQAALNFLETQIINLLNIIGNALGFGNVGSDLSTFLTNLITFFTNNSYGLPAFFGFFGTYFTNFLRWLQIDFQFIGPIFSIANAILIFGVNGIAEAITIITIGLQMLLFGYGTFTLFAYFLYVGDDGIGGLFTYLGTLEAISFKILNSIVIVTNLGIDFLVMMVSLIPKPFIQMNATRIPRLPTIESNSTMSFPALDFGEARNGNLIVYWLWCMGLWFLCWFESQNPALPGSIVALDPALATNVRLLSNFIPLMQAATLVSGGLLVIWFCMLPMRLAGIDVTEAPLGASLGRRTGPGPSSVHISGGKKHLIGPAKKAEKEKQLGQVKKEEQARTAIEKAKKAEEEKKRSEELRKRELERKSTGKDLRGPNLQ